MSSKFPRQVKNIKYIEIKLVVALFYLKPHTATKIFVEMFQFSELITCSIYERSLRSEKNGNRSYLKQ